MAMVPCHIGLLLCVERGFRARHWPSMATYSSCYYHAGPPAARKDSETMLGRRGASSSSYRCAPKGGPDGQPAAGELAGIMSQRKCDAPRVPDPRHSSVSVT